MSEGWETLFRQQLARIILQHGTGIEHQADFTDHLMRMLLDDGESIVADVHSRLSDWDHPIEPQVSLIQLLGGTLKSVCEQDLCREQEGLPSLFVSAPMTSRWFLREIVSCSTSVLLLSSRSLDIQAAAVLRQAWELAARAIVLADDPELGAQFDRHATTEPGKLERSSFEGILRKDLGPSRAFDLLAGIEARVLGQDDAYRKQVWQVFRDDYSVLSNVTHGGSLLAGISEWANGWRYDKLFDGSPAPVEGNRPFHFSDYLVRTYDLLAYMVDIYPRVAFRSSAAPGLRPFYDDWVLRESVSSEFDNEYRLFVALQAVSDLMPEYFRLFNVADGSSV